MCRPERLVRLTAPATRATDDAALQHVAWLIRKADTASPGRRSSIDAWDSREAYVWARPVLSASGRSA
eukprot:6187961-Pleurochrysis_carterae.AAC.2